MKSRLRDKCTDTKKRVAKKKTKLLNHEGNDPEMTKIVSEGKPSTFPITQEEDKCTVSNDKTNAGLNSSTMKDDGQHVAATAG
jgi:hypothetical protein